MKNIALSSRSSTPSHWMETAALPEYWNKFLLTQPEPGMDYQIVAITLRDGRVIEDVAIVGASIIGEVRGLRGDPFRSG